MLLFLILFSYKSGDNSSGSDGGGIKEVAHVADFLCFSVCIFDCFLHFFVPYLCPVHIGSFFGNATSS